VGALEPHFWKKFMNEIGLQEYQSMYHGLRQDKGAEEIKKKIEEKLSNKTAQEWEDHFTSKDLLLPVIRLRDPEEVSSDTLLEDRKMFAKIKIKEKEYLVSKLSLDYVNFLKKQNNIKAPTLGEHNNEFLKSKL
jgi:crotonobetainyl-CoA:carnitine CoA-transferase CaiB-like acyl-CoA transferase